MIRENTGGDDRTREHKDFGAERMTEQVKDAARDAVHEARRQAAQAGRKLKESGEQVVEEQKNRLAGIFSDLSEALQQAGGNLDEKGDRVLASYAQIAADKSDQARQYIQEHDVGDVVEAVQELSRRRPELFLGAMLVVGFAAARLLKALQHEPGSGEGETFGYAPTFGQTSASQGVPPATHFYQAYEADASRESTREETSRNPDRPDHDEEI